MSRSRDGIYRRADGLFAFRYKDAAGIWREKRCGTDDRDEAKQIKKEFEEHLRDGTLPTDKARWTVEQAATQWCEFHALYLKSGKSRSNEKSYLRQLVRLLGNRRLKDITIDDISRYKLKRSHTVGAAPINRELRILKNVLNEANLWEPIARHYKQLPEDYGEIGRALTPEQIQRLTAIASSNPKWLIAYHAQILAVNTGLRGGEIKRLQLRSVDLEKRRITVFRGKTKASARVVELNRAATEVAAALYERAQLLGAREPEHYLLPGDLSRHTKSCDPLKGQAGFDPTRHQNSWGTAWNSLRRAAGSEFRGLRFHDLRHTFVTWMAEGGVPLSVLKPMVGHMSDQVTKHYTHISDTAARRAVEILDQVSFRGGIRGGEEPSRVM